MDRDSQGQPADDELVRRAQDGDREAFDALIERHLDAAFAAAFARLRQREAAEDAVQEAFLRAWLHLGRLRVATGFRPWVCRIARNLAADRLRTSSRQERIAAMVPLDATTIEEVADRRPSAAEAAMQSESAAALAAALGKLSAAERDLVLQHFSALASLGEIGDGSGVHRTTVARRLAKAVARLGRLLGLRAEEKGLRASPKARRMACALVAAAAAMPEPARAALAAKCVPPMGTLGTLMSTLEPIAAVSAAGVKAMSIGQKLAAVVVLAGALAGIGFVATSKDPSVASGKPAAESAASSRAMKVSGEAKLVLKPGESAAVELDSPMEGADAFGEASDVVASAVLTAPGDGTVQVKATMRSGKVQDLVLRPDAKAPEQWEALTSIQIWAELNRVFVATASVREAPGSAMEVALFSRNMPELLGALKGSEAEVKAGRKSPQQHLAFVHETFAKNGMLPQDAGLMRAVKLAGERLMK